jgi:hypothetical protein
MVNLKQSFENRAKRLGLSTTTKVDNEYSKQFQGCKFWIWDKDEHREEYDRTKGKCCYNHIIGLPRKHGKPFRLFDYQKRVLDALESNRLIVVFKARASGITELMLRYMGWLCLKDSALAGTNMIVISAPAEELSISFIRRLKAHHEPHLEFDTKEKVCILNQVRIEAFPSHNLRRLRGLTDVSFVLAEESDFWNRSEEDELLPTVMPLTQKSNPYIALVSTPGRLGGLMHRLSSADERTSRFKKVYIPYTEVGLFSNQEIELAKLQPNFQREFNLQWGVGMGNVFNPADLQRVIDLGKQYADSKFNEDCIKRPYPHTIYPEARAVIGVDPAGGSSLFAICGLQIWNGKCHVFYAKQFERPYYSDMIEIILKLWYGTHRTANIFVDAANPTFIKQIKSEIKNGEQVDVNWQLEYLRRHGWLEKNERNIGQHMIVCPVSFGVHGALLLQTAATYIQRGWIAIHPSFSELIQAMHAARTKENAANDWSLDKSSHSMDMLDSFRLCMYTMQVTNSYESEGVLAR